MRRDTLEFYGALKRTRLHAGLWYRGLRFVTGLFASSKSMKKDHLQIIDWLLSACGTHSTVTYPEFSAFWQAYVTAFQSWKIPVDRAVAGGAIADCIAFAFAAGYCAALQHLVPTLPENAIACFCITEEGGGHPRAIRSRLEPAGKDGSRGERFTLNGKKKYVTCASEADFFIVAASEGVREDGKNSIRMVKISSRTPGIRIVPMKTINLVPEISHGELIFTDTPVFETDLLGGDGYLDYIKPFRTIEDLHVSAAILGYLFKNACRYDWDRAIKECILGRIVSVRALASGDVNTPAAHIVVGEVLGQVKDLMASLKPCWEKVGGRARANWDRDKHLMNIADKARAMRSTAAWASYRK